MTESTAELGLRRLASALADLGTDPRDPEAHVEVDAAATALVETDRQPSAHGKAAAIARRVTVALRSEYVEEDDEREQTECAHYTSAKLPT